MQAVADISLECCEESVTVEFRHSDAPFLGPGKYRQNVICPGCSALVIVTLTRRADAAHLVEQEVVNL